MYHPAALEGATDRESGEKEWAERQTTRLSCPASRDTEGQGSTMVRVRRDRPQLMVGVKTWSSAAETLLI